MCAPCAEPHHACSSSVSTSVMTAWATCFIEAGVTSVLNFAPMVLNVPPGVDVRKVDLSIELQILAFHEQRKSDGHVESGRIGQTGNAR